MLAARARGVGTVWTTAQGPLERELAKVLGLPFEEVIPAAFIPLAFTLGTDFKPAPRIPRKEVLHWEPSSTLGMPEHDVADAALQALTRAERTCTGGAWLPSDTERVLAARLHQALGETFQALWERRRPGEAADPATAPGPLAPMLRARVDRETGPLADVTQAVAAYAEAWTAAGVNLPRERQRVLLLYGQLLAAVIRDDASY